MCRFVSVVVWRVRSAIIKPWFVVVIHIGTNQVGVEIAGGCGCGYGCSCGRGLWFVVRVAVCVVVIVGMVVGMVVGLGVHLV